MCNSNGNESRRWRDLETSEIFVADALRKYLKGNGIRYEVSDCTPPGAERPMWHFSVYCDIMEAATINGFLDDVLSRKPQ